MHSWIFCLPKFLTSPRGFFFAIFERVCLCFPLKQPSRSWVGHRCCASCLKIAKNCFSKYNHIENFLLSEISIWISSESGILEIMSFSLMTQLFTSPLSYCSVAIWLIFNSSTSSFWIYSLTEMNDHMLAGNNSVFSTSRTIGIIVINWTAWYKTGWFNW